MSSRLLILNRLICTAELLIGGWVVGVAVGSAGQVLAQAAPGGLGRDRSLPSQTFFEDGADQLEREIQILQQHEHELDTAILVIQDDVQLSPYDLERLTDDVEIQPAPNEPASGETNMEGYPDSGQ